MIDRAGWNGVFYGTLLMFFAASASAKDAKPSGKEVAPAKGIQVVTGAQSGERVQRSTESPRTSRGLQPMMVVNIGSDQPTAKRSLGGYTRLVATFQSGMPDNPPRVYNDERRSFLARYFAGKSIGRLFSVKTTLARPRVSTITTFASIGYTSNNKSGEAWVSQIDPIRVLTPYFRIDADSAINLEATTSATSTYQLSAAAGLLDVIKRAAKLVAPTTTLVTSLNKERFEDASSFVDQSISSLLQESIIERSGNDFLMKEWVGKTLLAITLYLPIANEITPSLKHPKPGQDIKTIGTWTIKSVPAILSVFSDTPLVDAEKEQKNEETPPVKPRKEIAATGKDLAAIKTVSQCADATGEIALACKAFERLDPSTVLNFQVDSGVPLGQALAGDTGIAAAREHLLQHANNDATGQENARALCALLADRVQVLGFNRFDIAAILWAYASQAFVTEDASTRLLDEANCSPLKTAYSVGLPRGGFAAEKTDVMLVEIPVAPAAPTTGAPAPVKPEQADSVGGAAQPVVPPVKP